MPTHYEMPPVPQSFGRENIPLITVAVSNTTDIFLVAWLWDQTRITSRSGQKSFWTQHVAGKETWNNEGCIYSYEKIAARENEQVDGWSDLNHHGKGLLISLNMIPTWKKKRTNTREYGYRIRFDRRKEVIIVQDNYRNNGRKSIQRK